MPENLHIVQVGVDDHVFDPAAPADTRDRQREYARLLAAKAPGSRLTYLVLCQRTGLAGEDLGPLRLEPLPYRGKSSFIALWRRLCAIHAARAIDLLTTQNPSGEGLVVLLFAKCRGIAIVGQLHFDLFSATARAELFGGPLRAALHSWLVRQCMPAYDSWRVVSGGLRAAILAQGLHPGPVAVLPVACAWTTQVEFPAERPPRVLFAGRLVKAKNLDLWLGVARLVHARLPEARFVIAGAGPLRRHIETCIDKLGLGGVVELAGAVDNRDLPAFYGSAALLLLTSNNEGFGRVLVEAALCSTPAVSTATTGARDIIVHGATGYLCDTAEDLSARVCDLLTDQSLRARLGQAARERARREFDPGKLMNGWVDLWLDTWSARARKRP